MGRGGLHSGSWHAAVRAFLCAAVVAACQPLPHDATAQAGWHSGQPVFATPTALGNRPALVLAALADSRFHGRDSADYLTADLNVALAAARSGDAAAVRQADMLLSNAFVRWARDLDTTRGPMPIETDRDAANPVFDADAVLRGAATAPDLAAYLDGLQRRHPIYDAMVSAMRNAPAPGRKTDGLFRNLERARSLPVTPVGKHVIVDAAGAQLLMFDGVRLVGTMKVVVGRPEMPTPLMSGAIRHVVMRPYWNLPVDIVRDTIAPVVLRGGPAAIRDRKLEILSDWSPTAKTVAAKDVDWRAVAAGTKLLRVRQRPGPDNMMGAVKFMLPNDLGIYLHDTPKKTDFAQAQRARSSGCVRVEDAARLARWLFDGDGALQGEGTDRTVVLPMPVPVYISYFTVSPMSDTLAQIADVYGRDAPRQVATPDRMAAN